MILFSNFMATAPVDSYVQLFGGPVITGLILIVVAVIQSVRSKQNTDSTVSISKQEANTHEFGALTEGFVAQFELMKITQSNQTEEIKELTGRVKSMEDERIDILEHLSAVEALVPVPPGPPIRPKWR